MKEREKPPDSHLYVQLESFRDRLPTVDEKGRRIWLYPKEPKGGRFWKIRKFLSFFQLLVLFGLPFLTIKGEPALMINILQRKLIFFGHVFWPEDLYLIILFFLSLVIFILLLTASFGRVFCGWACPQTIFMELVFRRIERWIEGDGPKQKKLDNSPWTTEKILKKSLKHGIFFLLSFAIGNLFLAYIVGKDTLFQWMSRSPLEHPAAFVGVFFFSLLFYGIFSRFREQACVAVCPYGRLQSVLQDENTIMVTYDFKRGEPRGKGVKNRPADLGDCIDCKQCVAVCPTGIDIRNGIQMECVNCTACIDA
ncbi:MAG: cytochrome c oxidase accessory protein CcoG, partial [Planctomycetota bacterium]